MNTSETIRATIQSNDVEKLISAYQQYTGNASATSDNLFSFLSHPTAEREEFLREYCSCIYIVQEEIVSPNYQVI